MPGAVAVFVVEQHDEIRMRARWSKELSISFLMARSGGSPVEIELTLLGADFRIDPFQHRQIERVLVAEIVIDQLLVDAGAGGDFVDPRAGQAVFRKFPPCRGQKLVPCRRGIAALGSCAT